MKNTYSHQDKSPHWKIHKDERRASRRAGGASAQSLQGEELGCQRGIREPQKMKMISKEM